MPRELGQFADHPHTAATAARRRLDQHGQLLSRDGVGIELVEYGHARSGHHLLGLDLGAHRGDRGYRRPDPREARVQHGRGEFGVLGEEPVSGVNRVGARRPGRGDQLAGIQIPVAALEPDPGVGLPNVRGGGVRIGVDGDGADAEPPAGGEHPPGDLAPVGDQNRAMRFVWKRSFIRKTPKFDVPLIGPLAMADKHIPSTVRVSRGSITPSS